jgi:hypothetical protein
LRLHEARGCDFEEAVGRERLAEGTEEVCAEAEDARCGFAPEDEVSEVSLD